MANHDPIALFRQALEDAGIVLARGEQITADGCLHRARAADDKAGARSIWYNLHLDHPIAGAAGDWRKGVSTRWSLKSPSRMTEAEREALRLRIANDRAVFERELAKRHEDAARRAQEAWDRAKPADQDHPYLLAKHIGGRGGYYVRQIGNDLVLPVVGFDGVIVGLQYIAPDGAKRFTAGMNKRGSFLVVADPPEEQGDGLVITEGWATAVYVDAMMESRGHYCVIGALDAGNLIHVATKAKELFPNWPIIIACDFDRIGMEKGKQAAIACHGKILPPPADLRPGETDWCDYLIRRQEEDGEVAHG